MNMLSQNPLARHTRLAYLGFALVIALLFDFFLWNTEPGFGFFLFVALYALGFVVMTLLTKQFRQARAMLLLIPMLVLAFDVMLYNNDLVHGPVMLFVAILMFVFSILLTLKNPATHLFSFSQIPVLRSIDLPFAKWGQMWRDLFTSKEDGQKSLYRKIAIALVIALPILFIFGTLFAQADAVFANLMGNIFDFNIEEETLGRIIRTFLITLFLGSLMYVVIDPEYILGEKKFKAFKIDNTITTIILSLVNILFLIFVVIQMQYLFGSHNFVLENNINFADYARSGFFQLAWVIALAGLMLIVFYRSTVFHGSTSLLKILKIFFIIQVGVIALSALKRMNLYQDEFGYTVLRLYVEWFIYFAMIILALSAVSVGIDWKFRNFLYTSMALGLVAFTVVASINVDRMIARENVDRYLNEGKELDIAYLVSDLSIDAVPEVKRAFENGFTVEASRQGGAPTNVPEEGRFLITKNNFSLMYFDENVVYDRGGWFAGIGSRFSFSKIDRFSEISMNWREFNFGLDRLKKL
jgi:hypothetical protein